MCDDTEVILKIIAKRFDDEEAFDFEPYPSPRQTPILRSKNLGLNCCLSVLVLMLLSPFFLWGSIHLPRK